MIITPAAPIAGPTVNALRVDRIAFDHDGRVFVNYSQLDVNGSVVGTQVGITTFANAAAEMAVTPAQLQAKLGAVAQGATGVAGTVS